MIRGLMSYPLTANNRPVGISRERSQFLDAAVGTVMLAAMAASRLFGVTNQSLWFDEGYTLSLASAPSISLGLHTFAGFTSSERLQPLYYAIIFLWSRLFGTSDLALRLPSSIFSFGACLMVYFTALSVSRNRRCLAILASAAYLLSSYATYYAQEARPYALVQFLSFALLFLWIREQHNPVRPSRCFLLVIVLCLFAGPFSSLLVFALWTADLIFSQDRLRTFQQWRKPLLFAAGASLVYLAICATYLTAIVKPDFVSLHQSLGLNFLYSVFGLAFGTTIGMSTEALRQPDVLRHLASHWELYLSAMLVFATLISVVVVHLVRGPRPGRKMRVLSFAALLYVIALFACFGKIGRLNILPRHASSLFALIFILLLLFASEMRLRADTRLTVALSYSLAGYLILNTISIYNYQRRPEFRKDDYRFVASSLNAEEHVPTFLAEGRPNLMQHYGFDVIAAERVPPSHFLHFVLKHSQSSREIKIVVNEHRSDLWINGSTPVSEISSDFTCRQSLEASYMQVFSCVRTINSVDADVHFGSGIQKPRSVDYVR